MDTRITELNIRHRILGDRAGGRAQSDRLTRLAERELPHCIDAAMEGAFGADGGVYVIRRLNTRLYLGAASQLTDMDVAQRWGRHLTGAVVHSIARAPAGRMVMRFSCQAEYVASFLRDLVRGTARRIWFYRPLLRGQPAGVGGLVNRTLTQNIEHSVDILSRLHGSRVLNDVLERASDSVLWEVWSSGAGASALSSVHAIRPLFAVAWELATAVGWVDETSGRSHEAMLEAYVRQCRHMPHWSDPSDLTRAVVEMFRFLTAQFVDASSCEPGAMRDVRRRASIRSFVSQRMHWDWLDRTLLADEVARVLLLSGADGGARRQQSESRPQVLSPAHMRLLVDLATALRRTGEVMPLDAIDSPQIRLRLYAILIAHADDWKEVSWAATVLDRLCGALGALRRLGDPVEALRRVVSDCRAGRSNAAEEDESARVPAFLRAALSAAPMLADAIRLGTAGGSRTARRAANRNQVFPDDRSSHRTDVGDCAVSTAISTPVAGSFLLVRAVSDARLSSWLGNGCGDSGDVPQIRAAILASLAARWAGVPVPERQGIDYGVRAFAGPHLHAESWGELAAYLSEADKRLPERLQAQLRRVLWAQRVLKEGRFHLDIVTDMCDRPVLAILDASGHCLVSAIAVESSQDIRRAVEGWMIDSAEWGLESRELVAGGAVCRALTGALLRSVFAVDGDVSRRVARADDGTIQLHRTAFERLHTAVDAVSVAQLGIESFDVALAVLALGLLRLWGRWLRGFAESSSAFLLHRIIRRGGSLLELRDRWIVRLESSPLDVVLRLSGYLDDIDRVSWLTPSRLEFIV